MKNVKLYYVLLTLMVILSVAVICKALKRDLNNDIVVDSKDLEIMSLDCEDNTSAYSYLLRMSDDNVPDKQRKYIAILALYGKDHALWFIRPNVWCAILEKEGTGFGITQIYVDDVNRIYHTEFVKPETESEAYVLYCLFNEHYGLRTDAEIVGRWNPKPKYWDHISIMIPRIKLQKEILW